MSILQPSTPTEDEYSACGVMLAEPESRGARGSVAAETAAAEAARSVVVEVSILAMSWELSLNACFWPRRGEIAANSQG